MKLRKITKKRIIEALEQNGTSEEKIKEISKHIKTNSNLKFGTDGRFCVLVNGQRAGVSKRTTHKKRRDEYNEDRAITIAAFRFAGLLKEHDDEEGINE